MKKISFIKYPTPASRINSLFWSETCFGTEFREFASFFSTERNSEHFSLLRRNGIPRVFCSAEWFRTEFREFFCFYCCSMLQDSEHSSPLRNGSERNSESFLFRGTAGIPPEQINCSVFRGIIFLSEIANPTL
jgi:hypothetical protein